MKKAILSVSAAAAMIGGLFYFGWYRNRHGQLSESTCLEGGEAICR